MAKMNTRLLRALSLFVALSLLAAGCDIPTSFHVETTSELGPETLERIDAINETMATGVEIGPETRDLIEELNQTIRDGVRVGFTDSTLQRVDQLLALVEQGVGIQFGLDDQTNATVNELIDTLDAAPGQWEGTVTEIISTLEGSTSRVASQMADEVRSLMDEARLNSQYVTAAVGTEFRCNVDFLGARAGDTVSEFIGRTIVGRLRSILSGEEEEPATPVPWVCQIIPDQVDLTEIEGRMIFETAVIKISGYDYVPENAPTAYIVDEAGARVETLQLYPFLSSPYQIQLNLQDIDFSAVPSRSRVVFEWPAAGTSYQVALVFPGEEVTPTEVVRAELTITAPSVDVLRGPAANYHVIGRAEAGATYAVTGRNGDSSWWQIDYEGEAGWVPASAASRNEVEAPVASIPLPPPTADFALDPPSGTAPLEVQFIDHSTGIPLRWEWDFGEGLPLYEQSPTHTYASEGTFSVTLRVENEQGFGEMTRSITVERAPMVAVIPPRILGIVHLPTPTPAYPAGSILFANFRNLGDAVHANTSIPTSTYECGIVGMAALNGDILESRTGNIVYAYMAEEGGTWWINADFLTHENHEDWQIDVMCMNRSVSDSYEFHRRIRVDPSVDDTISLESLGIPADRYCGVVGMAAWNGNINTYGAVDHVLNAFVQRNAGTGIWELTANVNTDEDEEVWDVDVLCVYDNPGVFLHREFYNQMGNRPFNTSVSIDDYACGIAGMASANGDINESGAGDILQVYAFAAFDHNWYVMADFRTHYVEEQWNIYLLCVRRTSVVVWGD
jgi:PKD repeat protein